LRFWISGRTITGRREVIPFPSTRAVTGIEVLSFPAALNFVGFGRALGWNFRFLRRDLAMPMACRGLVEQLQALFHTAKMNPAAPGFGRNDPDDIPRRDPVELIARLDTILVHNNPGDGQ
jgi:hypothetical protein